MINAYLNNEIEKTNMIVFTINLDYGLYNQIYETACAGYDMTLIYISPEEIGAGNREEENKIIEGLKEVGVKVFKVNISDDIKQILGCSL